MTPKIKPTREEIRSALPLRAPMPCPICGAGVVISAILEWETRSGSIVSVDYACETEPDLADSQDWERWFTRHYAMPSVDWLPWERVLMCWLVERFFYHPDAEQFREDR